MSLRRENRRDDNRRTIELLNSLDRASEMRPDPDAELDDFESVVLFGLANDKATTNYPPAGHRYPKRG